MNEHYPFENTPLPYGYDALEPYIDEKTMHLHHDRHLQAYIDNLNSALKQHPRLQALPLDGGLGYIEKDSGTSFPCSYLWLQCSDFPKPCSLMLSIAHVPFCASSFRGCICAVLYQGREYRLVTYRGVKILSFSPEHICLSQGGLLLELDIAPSHAGHTLRAPQCGKMSRTIRESCNAHLRARLWKRGKTIFDLKSDHAAYEFVPDHGT